MQSTKILNFIKSSVLLLLCLAFLFYKYMLQISPAAMSPYLLKTFSISATGFSFLASLYFYSFMIMQIPAGIILDRFNTKIVIIFSILVCCVGALIFSRTNFFVMACLARLLIGFGAAFASLSYLKICSMHFPSRYFGVLTGFFATICLSGAGMVSPLTAWLINRLGYQTTLNSFVIFGFLLFIIFSLYVIFFYNKDPVYFVEKLTKETTIWKGIYLIGKNKSNLALVFFGGFAFTPVVVFGGLWGIPYLREVYQLSLAEASTSVSLMFWGSALGAIFFGILSALIKERKKIFFLSIIFAIILYFFILYVSMPLWLLNTTIFLLGNCASSTVICYVIARETNPIYLITTVLAIFGISDAFFSAITELLIGYILDSHWDGTFINLMQNFNTKDFRMALSTLLIYFFLAILSIFFINDNKSKNRKYKATNLVSALN